MRNRSYLVKHPKELYEILLLRQNGWSFNALAELYNIDRTSIREHARKYFIIPLSPCVFNPQNVSEKIIIKIIPKDNKEKSYEELVKEKYPDRKKISYW